MDTAAAVRRALAEIDRAFVEGDADLMESLLADDAELYWHHRETIAGRTAVADAFRYLFSIADTSAWTAHHHTVEVHEGGAYVMSDFSEDLLPLDGMPGRRVHGRAVFFLRRTDAGWLFTRLLSARSAPDDPVPPIEYVA